VNPAGASPVWYDEPMASLPAVAALLAATLSASPEAAALAQRVQGFYERTRDLEARFTQTYAYANLGRAQVSSGRLRVKKPGMMRWDYEKPTPKTVAVKGKRLVQFEPDENQAYVDEKFDASAMSAAITFLVGTGDLAREFDLSLDPSGALLLKPKEPDPRVASIALTVGLSGEVTETRVRDGSGNENRVKFERIETNRGLKDADFDVALPKDVHRVAPPQR
jgi:outer membrane lipoprotein carrier protein